MLKSAMPMLRSTVKQQQKYQEDVKLFLQAAPLGD